MSLAAILALVLKYANVVVALAPTLISLGQGIADILAPGSEFSPDDVVLSSWDSAEDVSDEVKMKVGELVLRKLREANLNVNALT